MVMVCNDNGDDHGNDMVMIRYDDGNGDDHGNGDGQDVNDDGDDHEKAKKDMDA